MTRYHRFPLADIGLHQTEDRARQVLIDIDAIDAIVEGAQPGVLAVICDGIAVQLNASFGAVAALIDPPGRAYETLPADGPSYPPNVGITPGTTPPGEGVTVNDGTSNSPVPDDVVASNMEQGAL